MTFTSLKKTAITVALGSLLLSVNAQAHDDDDDVYLTLIPFILYDVLSEPRIVVHRRTIREGRFIPRFTREVHYPKKHRTSRSKDHYKYRRHGKHHRH